MMSPGRQDNGDRCSTRNVVRRERPYGTRIMFPQKRLLLPYLAPNIHKGEAEALGEAVFNGFPTPNAIGRR